MFECRLCSSLAKVFPDEKPQGPEFTAISALGGETVSFQIAFSNDLRIPAPIRVEMQGELSSAVTLRRVGLVPVENMGECLRENAENLGFVRRKPGLFPDVLYTDMDWLHCCAGNWCAVWADIRVPENMPAGEYPLTVKLLYALDYDAELVESREMTLTVTVSGVNLPPQKLIHTEWFHCDCLAQEYRVTPWSEAYWQILANYFRDFAAHGINLLLTPLFTLPMDTAQGKERLTTQLIIIKKCGSDYRFDFTRLKRWIDLAQECGIHLFEFSHLFSQGGAKYPTKIVADVDGKEQIIFGWDKPANDPEFKRFLDIFLPLMVEKVKEWGLSDQVYFHVGDEPNDKVLDTYSYAAKIMQHHLKGFRILDAASHVEFYEQGLLDLPVPIEMCLKNFLKFPLRERWTYYCGGPDLPYSNRLHTMPASANRIMGTLLYWYQCDGFLHWGYNFWNSGRSLRPVNPLGAEPDFDYHPGDQYLVYPGQDGCPIDSMHYEVFYHGLQDLRAYQKLESLTSREKVLDLIRQVAGYDLEMNHFPLEEDFLFRLRDRVNQEIRKASAALQ